MRAQRSAYTLLEMLLATTIALLILYGLYVAMDLMVFSAQVGREVVEEATLSRSVVTRMTNDLSDYEGVSVTADRDRLVTARRDTRVGVWIGQGVRVGRVGASGHATGPHLHFEVRVKGASVDPLRALPRG